MNTTEMELALVKHFDPRINLIVPNVSWGWADHECDLLIFSSAGYATEIEIKISKADIKRDLKKRHSHTDRGIKKLYFAIPSELSECANLIPEKAGIITVGEGGYCKCVRSPKLNKNTRALTPADRYKLASLAAMRVWNLKAKLNKLQSQSRGE